MLYSPKLLIVVLISVAGTIVGKEIAASQRTEEQKWVSEEASNSRRSAASRAADPMDDMFDPVHGIKMGVPTDGCDDGMTDLGVDWGGDAVNYTCYNPRTPIVPTPSKSQLTCTDLEDDYSPMHFCMKDKLTYDSVVPTYGDHRPLWPKFGEYKFVPVQRWLHNIEHGSVVMLYHPCTHHEEVEKLRKLVTGCLRKHIITPYQELPVDRPLSLVAWGCHLSMSTVDEPAVIDFIRSKALHGPEGTYPKQGQYVYELTKLAVAPEGSNILDTVLCPNMM